MAAVEKALLATSKVPANSGHALHKGTPRESFIKEFLQGHLPEALSIGQGEIISAESKAGDARNQFDVVLHKKGFPRLFFGGGINGFLVESVVATIEVKSTLTKEELRAAAKAAHNVKQLKRHTRMSFYTGDLLPAALNIVVAYDGPAKMETVKDWLTEIHDEEKWALPALPLDRDKRVATPSACIDGVFLLGRGFVQFDNLAVGFVDDAMRAKAKQLSYYWAETDDGTLLMFFTFLTIASLGLIAETPELAKYLEGFRVAVSL